MIKTVIVKKIFILTCFVVPNVAFCPLSGGRAMILRKLKNALWKVKDIVMGTIGLCDKI